MDEARRKAEEALKGSEARLELALEAAHMGTWDSNLLTGELGWSGAVEELFGLEEGSFEGTREALYELIHPDDRDLVRNAVEKALKNDIDFVVEHRVIWPDGSLHWLGKRGRVIKDETGTAVRMTGTVRDITERKQAEARREAQLQIGQEVQEMNRPADLEKVMRVCFEQLQDVDIALRGLVIHRMLDPDTQTCESYLVTAKGEVKPFVREIPFVYKMFESGVTLYRRDLEADPEGLPPNGLEEMSRRYGVPIRCVLDIPHARGTFALVSDRANAYTEADVLFLEQVGEILSLGIARLDDLERLEALNQELQEANRAKSEFLARMSHEIRTPMNGVIGMTELLGNTEVTPQQQEYLKIIISSADSLLGLINDILDFSKIEAGKLDLEAIPFPLRDTVGDTLQTLAIRASERDLELTYHIPPEVPEALLGDPNRLRQILVNLVGNAIKFTDEGEVSVEVGMESKSDNEVCLQFEVRDTGIGISEEQQEHIFDLFSQADVATTREYGGTGLGLAIASQLSEMMGGRMWIDSELGSGSTFFFTAQFKRCEGAIEILSSPEILLELPVLIVDDNQTNRLVFEEMLSNWGMRPVAVESGPKALVELTRAWADEDPYQLILLDSMMPKMDGFELAERILANPDLQTTRLLMLTSARRLEDITRSREMGFKGCLTKPVKQSDLLDAITQAFEVAVLETADAIQEDGKPMVQRNILVVEDGLVNQQVAKDLLQQRGHTVTVANNGKEALRISNEERFDLILMDVQMPEMDGFEATAAIREREKVSGDHVWIVAMTANAMEGDRESCLEAGMDDYLAKPVRANALYDKVEEVGVADDLFKETVVETEVVYDWEEAVDLLGGEEEILENLVHVFLEESPKLMSGMQSAILDRDFNELQRNAHTMKSSAGVFCASSVLAAAQALESTTKERNMDAVQEAYPCLEDELGRLVGGLKEKVGYVQ